MKKHSRKQILQFIEGLSKRIDHLTNWYHAQNLEIKRLDGAQYKAAQSISRVRANFPLKVEYEDANTGAIHTIAFVSNPDVAEALMMAYKQKIDVKSIWMCEVKGL